MDLVLTRWPLRVHVYCEAAMNSTSESPIKLSQWLEERAKDCEKRRDHREAIKIWTHLLKIVSRSREEHIADVTQLASIHYHLGLNHRALREESKSMYHLKYSIRLNSSEPRYYQAFGRGFLRGGHWQVAQAQFEKAVRLDPRNVSYLRQYTWVLLMMGRTMEARYYAKRAVAFSGGDARSLWLLTRAYMESQMYSQALTVLRRMKRTKELSARIDFARNECRAKLEMSIEGAVLKLVRLGMRFDQKPFNLSHYHWAERLWTRYCLRRSHEDFVLVPSLYAAGLSWLSLQALSPLANFSFDDLLLRFSTNSNEVWPAIKRLQEFESQLLKRQV